MRIYAFFRSQLFKFLNQNFRLSIYDGERNFIRYKFSCDEVKCLLRFRSAEDLNVHNRIIHPEKLEPVTVDLTAE